ncbi:MAG TPA: S41 family peptidase [Bryobacteraceae bacterium]|nr:S41 family peptidase [Bryobacteraceae bacterium]
MSRLSITPVLFLAVGLLTAQSKLQRYPSYSDGKIAFSYLGDIWVANADGTNPVRLTDNVAREEFPRFSPDGKWIAFSSNRAGNFDVYVIPADGGSPRQLTFHSANDSVVGWTPDSRRIIFTSSRDQGVFPNVATLFEVSVDGGLEQPILTDWGSWASFSADGSKLAFTRHPGVWSRKHYRGSYAVDLWVEDITTKKFTRLGDDVYKGNYLWPMYGRNGEIYYVADEMPDEKSVKWGSPEIYKSVNNIWKISDRGGKPVQVTHHSDGNLYFPSISADGKTIVYEDNFGLWKLDTASGRSTEIRIDIKSDPKENATELVTINNQAQGFNLSPSTRRAAISTHGEIFTIATGRGEVQRVTDTPWREDDPRWSPDGKWIAFVSDRTGRQEVWIADEMGRGLKKLSDADCDKPSVVWAPDSKSLLWSGSDHKLRHVDISSGGTQIVATSDVAAIATPQFSPDGAWISYSKRDRWLRDHVYIQPASGGTEHMIGADDFLISSGARWTPDGKHLLFLGGVGAPAMSALNRTILQIYSLSLTRSARNPDDHDVDTEAQAEAETPRRGGAEAMAKVDIKIEWDGIGQRIHQLTHMPGSVMVVSPSPDGRTYAFMAQNAGSDQPGPPGLYVIAEDGTRLTRIPNAVAQGEGGGRGGRGGGGGFGGAAPEWSKDGRSLYFLQGGGIYMVAVPASVESPAPAAPAGGGGRGAGPAAGVAPSTPRRISFTVHMEIDRAAERKQVFEEAWRTMKNRFYDGTMHGVNWAADKDRYETLLPDISDSEELHNVVMEMIGELNASHTGISGGGTLPGEPPPERIQTHYPGFDLAPDSSGYYKVAYIYRKGPADHDYIKIAPGDFILAVNGKPLKTPDNYWREFNVLTGRDFEFAVNSKPQSDGAWTVRIQPITQEAQGDLEYERWVQNRKDMVEKMTKGEIGYLHIRAMNAPSLERFERDLLDNLGKKALIIDERFNGGGGIDQELLEILNQRKKYESYRARDSVEIPRPIQAFFGPMVVLANERSASNAEMFPEGFKTLGLGEVVGVPTYGAVIGTGSYNLLDGSQIRTPGTGVFTSTGRNFENYGVPPDVYIDNAPPDFLAGHDRQIEKAIEILRSELN